MARIKMHIPKAKLPFYPPCKVKCRLQNGVSTRSLATFYCLLSFRGANSPFSSSWSGLIFFKFGMAYRPRLVGGEGRGIAGGCILGASFELPPLFLLASRPFKPSRFFWSISSSSSSDSESIQVITNYFG